MYVKAEIVEEEKVIDTIYDDVPFVDDLVVGTIIPEERLHSDDSKSYGKFEII